MEHSKTVNLTGVAASQTPPFTIPSRTPQKLAAFYTPMDVAQTITDWAIRNAKDRILDPSYGGCAFLCAALAAFTRLRNPAPGRGIFGVDVDPNVVRHLASLLHAGAERGQFAQGNFLAVEPQGSFSGFDCILGNPPYINYHDIEKQESVLAQQQMAAQGLSICARASYWAYFILHSLRFLKEGGRMGMLLPISFARTDYATTVRHILSKSFKKVHVVFLGERIFENTDEQALILLCEGKRRACETTDTRNIAVFNADNREDLRKVLGNPHLLSSREKLLSPQDNLYKGLISDKAVELYEVAERSALTVRLGDWADTRIGVVTGANNFFIASASQIKERKLARAQFTPIVRRPREMTGLWFTDEDAQNLEAQDKECLLLSLDQTDAMPETLSSYIESAPDKVRNAAKCRERSPWFCVRHRYAPEAFIHCMSSDWPRIVSNYSEATCTNNIYRLSWSNDERTPDDWLRLSLGSLSTLFQFSSEWCGRSYGSGVLKLEPKEVQQLCVPIGSNLPSNLADSVDQLLRRGEKEQARAEVDGAFLGHALAFTSLDISTFEKARDTLQLRRQGQKVK